MNTYKKKIFSWMWVAAALIVTASGSIQATTKAPNTLQKTKRTNLPARSTKLKTTTIDLGKLAYNLGKAEATRQIIWRILRRHIGDAQQAGFFSGDTLQLASAVAAVFALVESIYDSYAETLHTFIYGSNERQENSPQDPIQQLPTNNTNNSNTHGQNTGTNQSNFGTPPFPVTTPVTMPITPTHNIPNILLMSPAEINYTWTYSVKHPGQENKDIVILEQEGEQSNV